MLVSWLGWRGGRIYSLVGFGGPINHFGTIVIVVLGFGFVFVDGGGRWEEVEEISKACPGVFR